MTDNWQPATEPPLDAAEVMLRFDGSGDLIGSDLDGIGFYWRPHGAFYRSNRALALRRSVHPIQWRELRADEMKGGGE